MYRGPLPGYYWDEEKRKYFRVQANHHSGAPPNVKYTKANIEKEQKENKKRKREETRQRTRKKYLVQRTPAIEFPNAAQVGVKGELGHRTGNAVIHERAQAVSRSLETHVVLDLQNAIPPPRSGYINWRPDYHVSCFDYDKGTRGLLLGLSPQNDSSLDSVVSVLPENETPSQKPPLDPTNDEYKFTNVHRPRYTFSGFRPVSAFQSPLSSIHVNSATRTLVTTSTGDRQPPTIQISQLIDPVHAQRSQPLDSGMSSLFRPPNLTTIFCSAINPWLSSTNDENIAIGTSGGSGVVLFTAEHNPEMGSRNWRTLPAMKTYSDVLAVDWLDPHLLAAGLRDASIVLYDIRAQQGVKRMKHSGGVIGLKRADASSRFVAAGIGAQLALYDLRFLRETDAAAAAQTGEGVSARGKNARRHEKSKGPKYTSYLETNSMPVARPLLKFDYDNQYDMLGLDVCAEFGLVAAAETGGFLRMSSLRTGKTVERWKLSKYGDERLQCVRFVEDERGVPKLMASCGPRIVELVW